MFLHPNRTKQAGSFHPGNFFQLLIGDNIFSPGASATCFYWNVFCLEQPYSQYFTCISKPGRSTLAQASINSKANDAEHWIK
jgi:hypothetical protein